MALEKGMEYFTDNILRHIVRLLNDSFAVPPRSIQPAMRLLAHAFVDDLDKLGRALFNQYRAEPRSKVHQTCKRVAMIVIMYSRATVGVRTPLKPVFWRRPDQLMDCGQP